jgi:hypothetical protein
MVPLVVSLNGRDTYAPQCGTECCLIACMRFDLIGSDLSIEPSSSQCCTLVALKI